MVFRFPEFAALTPGFMPPPYGLKSIPLRNAVLSPEGGGIKPRVSAANPIRIKLSVCQ